MTEQQTKLFTQQEADNGQALLFKTINAKNPRVVDLIEGAK